MTVENSGQEESLDLSSFERSFQQLIYNFEGLMKADPSSNAGKEYSLAISNLILKALRDTEDYLGVKDIVMKVYPSFEHVYYKQAIQIPEKEIKPDVRDFNFKLSTLVTEYNTIDNIYNYVGSQSKLDEIAGLIFTTMEGLDKNDAEQLMRVAMKTMVDNNLPYDEIFYRIQEQRKKVVNKVDLGVRSTKKQVDDVKAGLDA